ncbi:MAG TPA: hypothetical protein VN256_04005 [Pyrinomonadaceae bacterium]|nr:hypothetical protein [Pyrinomonadaceae bacterium]
MSRKLSSDTTLFLKFVLPGILTFAGVFICFIFVWIIASGQGFHFMVLVFLYIWAWAAGFWCHILIPIKEVSLDGYSGHLYISNYRREVVVPVSEIKDVRETDQYGYFYSITLTFKRPTEFGRKIKFLPYPEWGQSWRRKEHSLVGELKRLAQAQDYSAGNTSGAG